MQMTHSRTKVLDKLPKEVLINVGLKFSMCDAGHMGS